MTPEHVYDCASSITRLQWERERFLECMSLYKSQRRGLPWVMALDGSVKEMRRKYAEHPLQHNLERALSGVIQTIHDERAVA